MIKKLNFLNIKIQIVINSYSTRMIKILLEIEFLFQVFELLLKLYFNLERHVKTFTSSEVLLF